MIVFAWLIFIIFLLFFVQAFALILCKQVVVIVHQIGEIGLGNLPVSKLYNNYSNNMQTQCYQDDSMVHFQVQSDEKTSESRVSSVLLMSSLTDL